MTTERTLGQRPRGRGVVMIITLLALMLIGALVFYVFNVGRQVQQRIVAQNAADATAISGAGWVARSFNTVAMNNVKMARLIAYVAVLDATDEALQPAYAQSQALHDSLVAQRPRAGGNLRRAEAALLARQMQPIIDQYAHDLTLLTPLKRLFKAPASPKAYAAPSGSLDVRAYTFFNGPRGRGRLWKAIAALDAFNQAVMGSLDHLSRLAATRIGRADMPGGGAMLLPGQVDVPWHRGSFAQFKRPVMMGRLPLSMDDKRINRGPYDTIFGWHEQSFKWKLVRQGVWHQGKRTQGAGPSGAGGLGPGETSAGYWDPMPLRRKIANGYSDYGPQQWMLRKLRYGTFEQSPFYRWRDLLTQWKLDYAFNGAKVHTLEKPIWRTRWNKIVQAAGGSVIGSSSPEAIGATRLFVMRLESDVPAKSGSFLSPGSYVIRKPGRIVEMDGSWRVPRDPCDMHTNDPRAWQKKLIAYRQKCPRFKQLSIPMQAQWRSAEYVRIGRQAWRFGSKMQRDGRQIWQYVYYFVLGVDVGTPVPVRNPFDFGRGDDRPAPTELDHTAVGPDDQAARRAHLRFLGVVEDSGRSPMWPQRFDADRVFPHALAIAQASVFNNHSWDLWTQMWHARLEPVSLFPQWVETAQAASAQAWAASGLSGSRVSALKAQLERIEPLAGVMLNH